jgi:1-acyl-sn-glycerol-3-phosphate acyltransferase
MLPRMDTWRRVARLIVRVLFAALFRVRLEGTPPRTGPYLLIANHQGWADAFLLLALLPAEPSIHFVGDRTATMTVWWKRTVLRSLGVVVPVARDGGSERGAITAALDLLKTGAVVGLFPEGRVSRAELGVCPDCTKLGRDLRRDSHGAHVDRDLAPFARGVGYLACKAGVPILPVWLQGTAELYLGRELTVRVGELIAPPTVPNTKPNTEAIAASLHSRVARLARPWSEPTGPRRLRWLTHLF